MLDDSDDDIHPLFHGAPKGLEFRKLRKRLVQQVREAIDTYGMARAGERWLVCLSGGKDSYTLLAVLHELKWRGLLPVELLACNLDQGQPGFPATVLPEFLTDGRAAPDRVSGHLFHRDRQDQAGGHDVQPLLAASAREPLPHRAGGGVLDRGSGPSPR
jgi:hypothetical protein